jgi:hypothetical protein
MTIPLAQISNEKGSYGTIIAIEWSDDNRHLLLKQTLPSGKEAYISFDHEDVAQTINITNKIKLASPLKLVLRDKKYDKYYAQDPVNGNIQTADLKNGLQTVPIITGAISFKSYADNLILYTTLVNAKPNAVNVMVLSNQTDSYKLQDLPIDANSHYLLDIAKYDNSWYYVTASASDKKAILYRDPLAKAAPNNTVPISPRLALLIDSPQFVSFSDNARFISMQNGKKFVIFDAELNRVYRYESPLAIAGTQQAKWMDGHRLTAVTDGKVQVFDFDGTNLQTLVASRPEFTPYFDRDYQYIYTLVPQADGHTGLQNGKLIVN